MKPSRTLVLQLCRLGDILQTTPLLRRLRRAAPEREIDLVVTDNFSHVPVPAALFDRLHVFPQSQLRSMLLASPREWTRPLALVREFVGDLGADPVDLAVNLTPDETAGLLMSQLPARKRCGVVKTPRRNLAVYGGWMQYFWATARSRALRAFNLVDMYTWAAGVACDDKSLEMSIPPEAQDRMDTWLRDRCVGTRPLIAIQLGASAAIRQWHPERFAAMVDSLPAGFADYVLVGIPSERPLADQFLAASTRGALDAVGLTSVPELGALLTRCQLLVTNDTGTMHVATAVGTRVVEITLGPALVHETGPYGPGHFIIEPEMSCFPCAAGSDCHHRSCHDYLAPSQAAEAVRYALTGGVAPPRIAGGRLLVSRRARSSRIEYVPLHGDQVRSPDIWRSLSADLWEESLAVPQPLGGIQPWSPGTALGASIDFDATLVATDVARLAQVAQEARAAARVIRSLPSAARKDQDCLATRAHESLEKLLLVAEVVPVCRPIVAFLRVEIESIGVTDLKTLARAQAAAFESAAVRASRMSELARASMAGTSAREQPATSRGDQSQDTRKPALAAASNYPE